MPHEDDEVQGLDDTNEPSGDEVEHRNTGDRDERIDALEQRTILAQLMADPDIQAVIRSKNAGKQIKVVEDVEEPVEDDTSSVISEVTKDLPENDPTKAILEKMGRVIEEQVSRKLNPLLDRLKGVEGMVVEVQRKKVQDQVANAQKKYKDLDQYRDAMVTLSKENPSLKVEDLYILAKSRAGKLQLAEAKTFSEKPNDSQGIRTPSKLKKPDGGKKIPQGRNGFASLLQDSLNKLELGEI